MLSFHANHLPGRQSAWNVNAYFLKKKREKYHEFVICCCPQIGIQNTTQEKKQNTYMSYKQKNMLNTYHAIGQFSRMSNSYFFLFFLENRSFLSPGDNVHEISICLFSGKITKNIINLSSAECAHRVVYKIQTYKIQLERKSKIHELQTENTYHTMDKFSRCHTHIFSCFS